MKNKKWSLLGFLLAFVLILSACTSDKTSNEKEEAEKEEPAKTEEPAKEDATSFPVAVENNDPAIEGGVMNVALVTNTPFQGIFSYALYEDGYDADILEYASTSLFDVDGDFLITDTGIASMDVDTENKKATIKIREGVKWSDGEPLKIEDVIYPYLIIGHKDYQGVRYDSSFKNIIGAEEYHDGKADTISGLKKIDETTLEISFKQVSPAIYSGGDGLWTYAEPSHYLADVPMGQLLESDKIRKAPLSLGAYKFGNIVNGESVEFIANEHYWQGKPKIEKIIVKTVPSTSIAAAIKAGEVDYAMSFTTDSYASIKDYDNITILGRPELYYAYLGFKLGKYDLENNISVMNPDSKMNDEKLRQAIGYAMDIEQVSEVFYEGLRERSNSLIPPVFSSFYDETLEGFTYNPDKAIEILDAAGYKDVDGDGFREDPEGKPLEISLAARTESDSMEAIISYYIQNWKDIGLNVKLYTGRLIEMNSFYNMVEADDPEMDMFMAAWGTGTDPSPAGIYSKDAKFNFTRYVSADMDRMLAAIDSPKAMDATYRANAFREWQEYMAEKAYVIPTQYRTELVPVSKRVKNVTIEYGVPDNFHEWELTAEAAPKAQ